MSIVLDGTNGITTPTYGGSDTSEYLVPVTAFKNRIINGAMSIWQRGTSFSAVAANAYLADRFFWNNGGGTTGVATVSRSTDTPTGSGFPYSLLATVTTAQTSVGAGNYTNFSQRIEGFNCYDLAYGTANAQSFTASFWVKSNLTGTFTGSFSQNGASPYVRTYPYSFTINAANTWQQITITVAGDTSGTIPYSNATGLTWDIAYMPIGSTYQTGTANAWNANSSGNNYSPLGVTPVNLFATVGNTLQVTGVQLEKGSTATSFDYRPYGTELALAQRYYYRISNNSANSLASFATGVVAAATQIDRAYSALPVTMRSAPTIGINSLRNYDGVTASAVTSVGSNFSTTTVGSASFVNSGGGLGVGRQGMVIENTSSAYLEFSAEL